VSRGALLRYKSIQSRGLDNRGFFGVPRDSRFDWDEKHRDAYWLKGDPMPGGKTCWRDRQRKQHIAQNDRYSSIPIVYARWRPLLPKNLVGAAGHSDDVYIIQVHRVEY
jgi:hypothetical protein